MLTDRYGLELSTDSTQRGMLMFQCECGRFAAAEEHAEHALALQPTNGWAAQADDRRPQVYAAAY